MSTTTIAILCLIALVAAMVLGNKLKANIGIFALVFAYIIGCVLPGKFASTVTTLFPIKIMMYLLTVSYFYGFAISNGTMQAIGARIVYACRNKAWLLPISMFFGAAIIAAAGGGGLMANIVMAPIAFQLAKQANFNPLLAYIAVVAGSPLGGTTFWSVGGVTTRAIAESSGIDGVVAANMVNQQTLFLAIVSISFFAIMYILFKGHKAKATVIDKPDPMTKNQKITLTLIVITVALVVIPSLINIIAPNPVCRYLANFVFEIQLLSLIMGLICTVLKLGDEKEVIRNQIPWGMILVICGVGTLVAVASKFGVIDMVSAWIGDKMNGSIIAPVMTAVGAALSFVSDGMGVVMPTFYPMMPGIAAATGVSIAPMLVGFTTGTWVTGASPISSGGALALSCVDEELRGKMFTKCLFIALGYMVWLMILASIGVLGIFA